MKKTGDVLTPDTEIRTPISPRRRVTVELSGESLTKQAFKDECDINQIVGRLMSSGQLPDLIKENPMYGDFSDAPSYQEALNIVHHAQTQFDALSSQVRERFYNDPARFLEFTADPNNLPEMVDMGLAVKRTTTNSTYENEIPAPKPLKKLNQAASSNSSDPAQDPK